MEIMEVMSIHVALPVIGVLICAFLVFAFGFRSPVQPPSFDFSEDKKNQKKTKKTKGKGQTNGHIIPVKEETPKLATPKSARQNTSNNNKPKSPTNEKKNKKSEKSTRPVSERQKPKPEEEKQDDVGWSVAVSKKKDKIRSKREAEGGENKQLTLEDIGFESKPEDVPAEVPAIQQEAPQEQRASKKKRQSKKSEGETTTVDAEEPKVKDVVPTPPEPTPTPVQTEVKTEDKPAPPSKKSKNKSDEVTEEKTDTKPALDPVPATSNKNTKKSKSKKLSPDAEEFQPMVYDNKPKTQISPKKPRNKNNSNSQESEEASKVKEIKEAIKPEEKTAEPVKNIIKEEKPKLEEKVKEEKSKLKEKVKEEKTKLEDKKDSSSENKTEEQQPVVFDELAATSPTWQDAPKIKKKKARREN